MALLWFATSENLCFSCTHPRSYSVRVIEPLSLRGLESAGPRISRAFAVQRFAINLPNLRPRDARRTGRDRQLRWKFQSNHEPPNRTHWQHSAHVTPDRHHARRSRRASSVRPSSIEQATTPFANTIAALEATGSPVITDGEQTKPSFATYPVHGLPNLVPGGVTIPFADGHTRQLPRLSAGPFRYRHVRGHLHRGRQAPRAPAAETGGHLGVGPEPAVSRRWHPRLPERGVPGGPGSTRPKPTSGCARRGRLTPCRSTSPRGAWR